MGSSFTSAKRVTWLQLIRIPLLEFAAGIDVKSPIDFVTHWCFQIYFLRVPPLIGFTVGSCSESVSGCGCKLHYAEDTEMSF